MLHTFFSCYLWSDEDQEYWNSFYGNSRKGEEIHQSVGKSGVFQVTGSNPIQNISAFRSWLSSGLCVLVRQVFASESTSSAQEESQAADFEDELLSYAQEWAVEHQFDRAVQLLNLEQN